MQIISLTFDDGLRCQIERAVPVLDKHGLPGTFFIAANTSPMHLDYCPHDPWRKIEWNSEEIRTLKDMVRRGHEIGSRSVWHKDPENSKVRPANDRGYDPKYEAEESKRLISSWMNMEIPSFCYPFCKKGGGLKDAVIAAGYKQARAGANEDNAYYRVGDVLDYFDIDCRHIGKYERRENVHSWLRHDNRWHILMFHGIGTDADGWWAISPEEFAREMSEIAGYRDAGKVQVLTFAEAAEHMRSVDQTNT